MVKGKTHQPKVNLVRYADDFIITGSSKELLENEVKPLGRAVSARPGLAALARENLRHAYRTRVRLPRTKRPQVWRQVAHPTLQEEHAHVLGKGAAT
jgi:hypothetical protein